MSEKRTKPVNLLAGLTAAAPDGVTYSENMKHGEESPNMLLALLNSPLETMANSQQAKILGTCLTKRGKATLVMFYGVVPTANGTLKPVGSEEK